MTDLVVTANQATTVDEIARKMVENRISAVPVVDDDGHLAGIVSEADLLRRQELGTERKVSTWLRLFRGEQHVADEFVRSRARRAEEVMSRPVVTVDTDTPLNQIANLLEERRIKRVIVTDGDNHPIGVVSRSDVVRALVSAGDLDKPSVASDADIRKHIADAMHEAGFPVGQVKVIVNEGVVSLWGLVRSEARGRMLVAAAECAPGVREVKDHLKVAPMRMWAD